MSGAEVIGLISGIIAIVGATVKVYGAATDASGLPEAFRNVAKRLPFVQETPQTAQGYLNTADPDEVFCNAIKPVLESCEDKAKRLAVIFEKVVPQADASRMERYLLAARTLGKGDIVESLMKGILDDVQLLTGNRVTKLPTEADIAHLIRTAIDEVSAIPPSLPAGLDSSISYDAERNTLLKELKWTDPTIDKLRIERTKGGLYEAASRWILAHPSYHQWRHDETKLLWIKGGAGKGKTMLLVAIIRELQPCTKLDNPSADSTAVSYLRNHYDRMGKEVFDVSNNNVNAFDALSNIFRQMVRHPRSETVYLAVDALDECEDGLPDLLSLIRESSLQENRLKWIVTSRNQVNVDESLALSLKLNSEAVVRAIEVYIAHKVSQIPSLKSNPAQRATVQQKLLGKADGTFLWVDLMLRFIYGTLGDDVVRRIDKIPSGLPPLYDRMMGDIGKSTSDYRDSCLVILSIATLAYRPLHILELRTLAGLEKYETADLERIVDMCGSFLTLLESRVYPIHQSAKDYLVSEAAVGKIFPSGTHSVHRSIVDRSVAAMEKVLSRDIYGLVHPGTLIHEVMGPAQDPLLGVGYSYVYWIDHVCKADQSGFQRNRRSRLAKVLRKPSAPSESTRLRDSINTFFQHHFLHWLEALSLLGVVTNGVISLTRFRNTFSTARGDAFVNLIKNAYRFILQSRWIIEQAPLQTYVSALLFAPVNSIIRGLFAAEEPSWVLTKPIAEPNWSPCLQTLEGHSGSVKSVAFSPDGSRIVSGSEDCTIKIWDAKSGKEVHTLKGYRFSVASVAFSPDGSRIVSGSEDRTIKIWDTKSGKEVRTLEGYWSPVKSVAFSPDGSRIVSGLYNDTVKIWDAKSGKEVRTLKGYWSPVNSVAFSPDGSYIVSGSYGGTIKIWDTKSGKEVRTLEGHGCSVKCVVFSPDGSYIVSVSYDTVKIWDTKSGKEVSTKRMGGPVLRLRFESFSGSGLRLQTNVGSILFSVGNSTDNHGSRSRVGDRSSLMIESNDQVPSDQRFGSKRTWNLNGDGSWITWCGRGAIWLPLDCRAGRSDVSSDGSAIAIGTPTGRMVVMRMSLDVPFS
ncbi:hypothetical protein DL767_011135 [Monosporascus sp. MG133]|nr:hypothetical protein DL767_011135 [Monosporascus sp. MG133]